MSRMVSGELPPAVGAGRGIEETPLKMRLEVI
jgi:hypothetical protein